MCEISDGNSIRNFTFNNTKYCQFKLESKFQSRQLLYYQIWNLNSNLISHYTMSGWNLNSNYVRLESNFQFRQSLYYVRLESKFQFRQLLYYVRLESNLEFRQLLCYVSYYEYVIELNTYVIIFCIILCCFLLAHVDNIFFMFIRYNDSLIIMIILCIYFLNFN